MNLDIENKILIPVLFLVIFPILAVGIFYYQSSQRLFLEKIEDELRNDLIEVSNIISRNSTNDVTIIEEIKAIKEMKLIIYDSGNEELLYNDYNYSKNKLRNLIQSKITEGEEEFNINSDNKLLSFIKIESLDWYIGTGKVISSIKSSLLEIQKYTILVAIIFVIIAVELAIFLAYNLSKPIRKLSKFCNIVSRGNYKQKVNISRKDEIGLLANSFNNMVKKINKSTLKLKNLKEFNEDIL